ncbi:hypothetical protein PR003_g7876 [Phytophthora rubi]|uniref:Uncharacterized protein n=1 Tax=Phytophthora rubi TaxID=129364 RepID=A0A6A4FWV5_9STRA|nr:hypothetical protein PR003_g7876 [Phytophthora rubi]
MRWHRQCELTLDEDRRAVARSFEMMDETSDIENYFGTKFERKQGKIYVLLVVPQVHDEKCGEQRARKKARSLTIMDDETMNSIADHSKIDMWHIALGIRHDEPDFPEWFY